MDGSDTEEVPDEIKEAAIEVELNLLPEKSRKIYQQTYRNFLDFCDKKNVKVYTEDVLLVYFAELSKRMKPSTLWSNYSMLKATLNINNNIDVSKYQKLVAFLKRQSKGHISKKSRVLEQNDIEKFLQEAPDDHYLCTKGALIFGLAGACRCDELMHIKLEDIQDLGDKLLVTLPDTKTKKPRSFVVKDYLEIYRKYITYRPNMESSRFFFKYSGGKGWKQFIGIHKFGKMPSEIAEYLKLTNCTEYTDHCFRRTSATLLVNSGGDITMLKRHGGWRSTNVAEGYIEESVTSKSNICEKIFTTNNDSSVAVSSSVSRTTTTAKLKEMIDTNVVERKLFKDCTNVTVNFCYK